MIDSSTDGATDFVASEILLQNKSRKCYRNATEWPRPRHACARATFLDLKICSGTRCAHQFSKNSYASSKSHVFTPGDVKPQDIYGGRTRFKYILSAQKNKTSKIKCAQKHMQIHLIFSRFHAVCMRAKTYLASSTIHVLKVQLYLVSA